MTDKIVLRRVADIKDFAKRLAAMKSTQKRLQGQLLALSIFTIEHFEAHGDLSPAQQLHDEMAKNFTRRPAYIKWLAAHAPVEIVKGQFKKDKSATAKPFNLEGALAKPFWDFAPEQDPVPYTLDDIKASVLRALKPYENEKRYVKNTDQAVVVQMQKIRQLVA